MAGVDLTTGPVWRRLLAMTGPMMIGLLSVLSVGLADAIYVGRLGEIPLAAMGYVFAFTLTISSLGIGLSAGAASVVARAIGAKEIARASRLGGHGTIVSVLLGIAACVVVLLTDASIFRAMGATGEALDLVLDYVFWWAVSLPFLFVAMTLNGVVRAHGDGVMSAYLLLLVAVVNIAAGPVLIFGYFGLPAFGVEGAGIATMAAHVAGGLAAILYAGPVAKCVDRACLTAKDFGASAREILSVAAPAAGSNMVNPFGLMFVTAAVATLGEAAVAGFGSAIRMQSFVLVPMLALSAAIGPVVGQNWGARKQQRSRSALAWAWGWCVGYGALVGAILLFAGPTIASWIAPDGDATRYTSQYLGYVGWTLIGYGMLIVGNSAMNAVGRANLALFATLFKVAAVHAPGAFLLVGPFGYAGVIAATVVANIVGAVAAMISARLAGLWPHGVLGGKHAAPTA